MRGFSSIGYIQYVIGLLLITGLLILRFDAKMYEMAGMEREQNAARITGWTHLSLGAILTLVTWLSKLLQ
ncbi:CLC_0170 family protein [Kroppenstedtia eburnea]|uniref:Uncharacterized protein n=1 Tax=Kroppenstedtia eburnea TaxID=714067 RepID=A0A1N7KPE4_9BACL|nr:CLC_0170 family protein [Kroppenstedtia eburnea]EGK12494.1 hypothetical protein HMPREF9374_1561 [Desmospora sp. 8437]QKI82877.1 hypothetical protein GXN75_13210 [Kroppenstedtia eburnea]SIS63448.1 hypothetical protein SAMN05421790_103195 [Kroppenstedtia eburnea]